MKLNHVNLTSTDIPADRAMFEKYFGLHCLVARGSGLLVMQDDDGMIFVLNNFSRKRGDFAYPEDSDVLHIGFIQATAEAVDAIHVRLVADGWDAPAPRMYHGAWTFYFKAKGGYFIEVAAQMRAEDPRAGGQQQSDEFTG